MSNERVERDTYDRGIIPAETAARKEREGEGYKHTPDQTEGDIDTTGGYTVDNEGLTNNFAVEPEMYYEEPGDLKQEEDARKEARKEELHDINDNDEQGRLSTNHDERSKGSGLI